MSSPTGERRMGGDFIPKPDCTRLDGACFREGECLADCDRMTESLVRGSEVRQLRDQLTAERAAHDATKGEVERLKTGIERLAQAAANWREGRDWKGAVIRWDAEDPPGFGMAECADNLDELRGLMGGGEGEKA